MLLTQSNDVADENLELALPRLPHPVEPRDVVVLAVGVVVAILCSAELIPSQQHGYAGGEQKSGQEVAHLALTHCGDGRVVRGALEAVVVRPVVIGAVAIVLAIGVVVLAVVGDEIGNRESVMRGDEVDGRERASPAVMEQVG